MSSVLNENGFGTAEEIEAWRWYHVQRDCSIETVSNGTKELLWNMSLQMVAQHEDRLFMQIPKPHPAGWEHFSVLRQELLRLFQEGKLSKEKPGDWQI